MTRAGCVFSLGRLEVTFLQLVPDRPETQRNFERTKHLAILEQVQHARGLFDNHPVGHRELAGLYQARQKQRNDYDPK